MRNSNSEAYETSSSSPIDQVLREFQHSLDLTESLIQQLEEKLTPIRVFDSKGNSGSDPSESRTRSELNERIFNMSVNQVGFNNRLRELLNSLEI